MQRLYQENVGLLRIIALKYRRACDRDRAVSLEDLMQTGFFGLVAAQKTYDPDGAKTWAGWAAWYIHNAIRKSLGLQGGNIPHHALADSLDRPLSLDDAEGDTIGDMVADDSLPDPDADLLRQERVRAVREAVEQLPEDQRRVIQLRRLEGRELGEVAASLGLPERSVSALDRKARERLWRSPRLREVVNIDEETRFMAYKGVDAYRRSWSSVVEDAVIFREALRERLKRNGETE